MCKEDIRFMRKTKVNQFNYSAAGPLSTQRIFAANPDRVAVIVSGYDGGAGTAVVQGELYAKDGNRTVTLGTFGDNHSLQVLAAEIGQLVAWELYVNVPSAPDPLVVNATEIVLMDELEKL